MPTAREVYQAFQSHNERQQKILDSVRAELGAVDQAYEAASDSAEKAIMDAFPALADLPLELLTQASALTNEKSRDFANTVRMLRQQAEENRAERARLVAQYGDTDVIERLIASCDVSIGEYKKELRGLTSRSGEVSRDLKSGEEKLQPLDTLFEKTGLQLTDLQLKHYADFRLRQWATSSKWRQAHRAILEFNRRGGASPNDLRQRGETLTGEKTRLSEAAATANGKIAGLENEKEGFEKVGKQLARLDNTYMSDEKIYRAIVAHIVELLQDEKAAQHIGGNLPPAGAQVLMAKALEFTNLQKLHDNLENLRKQAEKALGQVSKPMSKLRQLKSNRPSHRLQMDLGDIESKLSGFNSMASGYVGRSQNARSALGRVNTYAGSSSLVGSQSTSHASDDTYTFMNYYLMYMLLSDSNANAAAHAAPSGDTCAPADAHHHVPTDGLQAPVLPDGGVNVDPNIHSMNIPDFSGTQFAQLDGGLPAVNLDAGLGNFNIDAGVPHVNVDVSMPNIDVSVPSFDVSVPSIDVSVPSFDVSTPSFDAGSFSSFDSGPSF